MNDLLHQWPLCVPVLSDGVVTLRAHMESDLDDMLAMSQDRQMAQWTDVPDPATMDDSRHFLFDVIPRGWSDSSNRVWAIQATDPASESGRFAGNVDLRGAVEAEIAFALHPWARGRKLMSRAVRLAARWGFDHGGIERIHWRAYHGNTDSKRVIISCGFECTGTVSGLLERGGEYFDAWTAVLEPENLRS